MGGLDRLAISPQCGFASVMHGNRTRETISMAQARAGGAAWPTALDVLTACGSGGDGGSGLLGERRGGAICATSTGSSRILRLTRLPAGSADASGVSSWAMIVASPRSTVIRWSPRGTSSRSRCRRRRAESSAVSAEARPPQVGPTRRQALPVSIGRRAGAPARARSRGRPARRPRDGSSARRTPRRTTSPAARRRPWAVRAARGGPLS